MPQVRCQHAAYMQMGHIPNPPPHNVVGLTPQLHCAGAYLDTAGGRSALVMSLRIHYKVVKSPIRHRQLHVSLNRREQRGLPPSLQVYMSPSLQGVSIDFGKHVIISGAKGCNRCASTVFFTSINPAMAQGHNFIQACARQSSHSLWCSAERHVIVVFGCRSCHGPPHSQSPRLWGPQCRGGQCAPQQAPY